MRTAAPLLAALSLTALLPGVAPAQPAASVTPQARATLAGWNRVQAYNALYGRSGPAHTPYGKVVNPTQTPEWKQGGNSPEGYMAIMAQKQMQAQAKEMAKQQREYEKRMAAVDKWLADQGERKSKGRPVDPRYEQLLREQELMAKQYAAAMQPRKMVKKPAGPKLAAGAEAKPAAEQTPEKKAETLIATAKALEASNPAAALQRYREAIEAAPDTEKAEAARGRIAALESKAKGKAPVAGRRP